MNIKSILKNICFKSSAIMYLLTKIYTLFGANILKIGRKNRFEHREVFLKRCRIKIKGSDNQIIIDKGVRLNKCKIIIEGNNNRIHICERCQFIGTEIFVQDNGNCVEIGEHVGLNRGVHIACTEGTSVTIGKESLFSSDIQVRTGDSHSIIDENGKRINEAQDIVIGDCVWVGNDAKILKGVRIGDNSVVGTGAIVTKEFTESNVILAGVPAVIVRRNVSWRHEKI